jgi:hypothetical protein
MVRSFLQYDEFLNEFAYPRALRIAEMRTRIVPLESLAPTWRIDGGALGRPDGLFYRVVGIEVRLADRTYGQPLIMSREPDFHGCIVLITDGDRLLVRLKAEPGNTGIIDTDGQDTCVLLAPPIQASKSSMVIHQRAVRGETDEHGQPYRRVPLCDLVTDGRFIEPLSDFQRGGTAWQAIAEDGGAFYKKRNLYGLVDVPSLEVGAEIAALGVAGEDFAWISREVLRRCFKNGLANGHLRTAMSLLI